MIPPPTLEALGLAVVDRVRWRERPGARWSEGRVVGRERDGSVGVREDGRGASGGRARARARRAAVGGGAGGGGGAGPAGRRSLGAGAGAGGPHRAAEPV